MVHHRFLPGAVVDLEDPVSYRSGTRMGGNFNLTWIVIHLALFDKVTSTLSIVHLLSSRSVFFPENRGLVDQVH